MTARRVLPVLALGTVLTLASAVGAIADGLRRLPAPATPSATARADIPGDLLQRYQQAAATCPGLGWPVLAAIDTVTEHDRLSGQAGADAGGGQGAVGPRAGTWHTTAVDGNTDGGADPLNPADAVTATALLLCQAGAARDTAGAVATLHCGADPACRRAARGPDGYVSKVLAWAARYADPRAAGGPAAELAVQTALAQLGTPYRWGGQSPTTGFDCSGLVVFAYAAAGLALPRTAQQQYDAGPPLPVGEDPAPGDLVFFGADPGQVTHVGIALGEGRMVDAPHTGARVRVEPVAGFGHYLGATRPAAALVSLGENGGTGGSPTANHAPAPAPGARRP